MDCDEARALLREEMGGNYRTSALRLLRLLRRMPRLYAPSPVRGTREFGDPVGDLVLVLEDLVERAEIRRAR